MEPRQELPPKADACEPMAAPGTRSPLWPERLSAAAATLSEWLSRPRVRLTVTGLILLLIGGLLMTNSVWTLPLVVVGALMVVIAWIGRRLDGRFAVQWGEAGTQLEFRAKITAPQPARPALARTSSSAHTLGRTDQPQAEDAEIIDGEAHTVEIDVSELKALIAAAEAAGGESQHSDASARATRNLRVAYGGAGPSEAGR